MSTIGTGVRRAAGAALDVAYRLLPPSAVATVLRRVAGLANYAQGIGFGSASIDEEVRAAIRFLPPQHAIVCDVGANRGDWTRTLLQRAGERVERVFVFEPSKFHRSALSELDCVKCEVLAQAVGATLGRATLFSNEQGSGIASLHQRRLEHFGLEHKAQETVEVTTLDQFAQERHIERVDFVKMDIEGHEMEALRGAKRLLTEGRVGALSFEFGGSNIDSRTYFQDFWYALRDYGFSVHRILPTGRTLRIDAYSEGLEAFVTTNYIASRPRL